MAADTMAFCVAMPSAAMALAMLDTHIPILHVYGFEQHASIQCSEMIANEKGFIIPRMNSEQQWFNYGGIDLVPGGIKPLLKQMLINYRWGVLAFTFWPWFRKCSRYVSVVWMWKLLIHYFSRISQWLMNLCCVEHFARWCSYTSLVKAVGIRPRHLRTAVNSGQVSSMFFWSRLALPGNNHINIFIWMLFRVHSDANRTNGTLWCLRVSFAVLSISIYSNARAIWECCARNMSTGQGQVITFHSICGM